MKFALVAGAPMLLPCKGEILLTLAILAAVGAGMLIAHVRSRR